MKKKRSKERASQLCFVRTLPTQPFPLLPMQPDPKMHMQCNCNYGNTPLFTLKSPVGMGVEMLPPLSRLLVYPTLLD